MIDLCDLQQLSVGAGLANGEEEETAGLDVATAEGREAGQGFICFRPALPGYWFPSQLRSIVKSCILANDCLELVKHQRLVTCFHKRLLHRPDSRVYPGLELGVFSDLPQSCHHDDQTRQHLLLQEHYATHHQRHEPVLARLPLKERVRYRPTHHTHRRRITTSTMASFIARELSCPASSRTPCATRS